MLTGGLAGLFYRTKSDFEISLISNCNGWGDRGLREQLLVSVCAIC